MSVKMETTGSAPVAAAWILSRAQRSQSFASTSR
jgi:hypothetical protein